MFFRNEFKPVLQSSDLFPSTNKSFSQGKMSQEQTQQQSPKKQSQLKQKNNLLPLTDRIEIRKNYYDGQQNEELKQQKQRLHSSLQKNKLNLLPKLESLHSDKSLYQTVIEIFPTDHPIWSDLVQKSQTIEGVIESNQAFFLGIMSIFRHLLIALYLKQSKLQALKNQIQLKAIQSQYNKDYQNVNIGNQDVQLDQSKAHDQMWGKDLKQLYTESVYNSQYLPYKLEKQMTSPKKDFNPSLSQSSYLSTYKSQFQNWKPKYPGKITRDTSPVEPQNLPFISESSYAREFKNVKTERSPLQKIAKIGPFAENLESLVKESTSSYYQQQQFSRIPSKLMRPISPKLFNASFEGYYYQRSYHINSDQESSFANRFYESNSVKKIFDRKIDRKIY
ncbi:unnamed protein product (macronuclear) [Paramecium tetraurelia]|uniref:Uncharacterized protein n=1 Tax=Paramecium tetraurelia TaxID=5888 RepID=A0EDR2_PARTE|nr:uncharacterized protein GSPATT00025773001 [Paramecium tetraurelia]CAK93429.1 unnamed protein product [Paramecium tetraurelia]|eukprot:XP_001460826.1 hypothetical protein (macronuclear) [Paramecium tetraurelia strain d4-2]